MAINGTCSCKKKYDNSLSVLTCITIITESFCNGPNVYSFKTNCISLYLAICRLISLIFGGWYKSTKLTDPPPFNSVPLCCTAKKCKQKYGQTSSHKFHSRNMRSHIVYLQLAAKVWLRDFGVRNLCNTDGTIDNMASTESFVGSVSRGSRDSAENRNYVKFENK